MASKTTASKRAFQDETGKDVVIKSGPALVETAASKTAAEKTSALALDIVKEYMYEVLDPEKPFEGAKPRLCKKPRIATKEETRCATSVASQAIRTAILAARSIAVVMAEDSSRCKSAKAILEAAVDDKAVVNGSAPVTIAMATDWLHTLPWAEKVDKPALDNKLLIYVGTPGKYASMCIRSDRGAFDAAYAKNNLVVLCKGVCMLPLGTQEENIFGVDEATILADMAMELKHKGTIAWGLGAGTKANFMQKAFGYLQPVASPPPITFPENSVGGFDVLAQFVKHSNILKMAHPDLTIKNYYDTGLTVSVLMANIVQSGISLMTDADGLAMLRDASIGHIISKLNQVTAVEPLSTSKSVYNFFIGDGACRLNGGMELAFHLMEGYNPQAMTNLFVFNNKVWAIEDNLVADTEKEHELFNHEFYNLLAEDGRVCMCETESELRGALSHLDKMTSKFLAGQGKAGMRVVVVRGLETSLPPVIGDIEPIRKSREMKFMRDVLGTFAKGCESKVPIYGCSAFEYIQFLHIFMDEMPEGKRYQYVCGRTDIQAAHMAGFQQPEGKCVLFINDVYGINSLGESLRFVLSGFGGRQLLVMIWHPSLLKVIDHFHLHRPPMVWPNMGMSLSEYFVRKESDALFVDFENNGTVNTKVKDALDAGTPLVVVNMLPEHECNYVSLDVRAHAKLDK